MAPATTAGFPFDLFRAIGDDRYVHVVMPVRTTS